MVTRRPSLIGRTAKTVARTALISGTATAVAGRVAGRQAVTDAPASTRPEASPAADVLEQLKTLGDLRSAGVLTEEEFAAQKARILG